MHEKWTPEQRDAFRVQGRPFRLALARQTPEEKAQQRSQISESLNAEQLDHILHLWQSLAREMREISRVMQDVHADLALQVRQLKNEQEQEDIEDHGKPLPAVAVCR